jgi:DNA-binding response OmpR family regulator
LSRDRSGAKERQRARRGPTTLTREVKTRFEEGCLSSGRILVVEDDAALAELLRVHLANAGYEVVLAEDAVAAGPVLLRQAPKVDLAIVDAQLPYLSGVDLLATMIADTTLPPIPAVLITGHRHLSAHAETLGVPCLLKPFLVDDLLSVVRQVAAHAG